MRRPRLHWRLMLAGFGCLALCSAAPCQQVFEVPAAQATPQPAAQRFSFASDGPTGPGWTRPDQIARVYFKGELPALFRRTIRVDSDVPRRTTLSWIFTGPQAGVTVELTSSKIRLIEREYAIAGLRPSGAGETILHERELSYTGHVATLTVVADSHLSINVLLNGKPALWEPLVFDLSRQQLMFSGPRNEHLTLAGSLLDEPAQDAAITVNLAQAHQTMLGFGGSPSVPAYLALSTRGKQMYWSLLRRYNLLIDREYPMGTELKQDLSNADDVNAATPHYYGDNFPNGEVSNFEYSRLTRAMGGQVLYEMWALPKWATEPYSPSGTPAIDAWGKQVRVAANPDVYARIVVEFCRLAKARSGAAPEIVGIENEVEQPPEVFAAMTTTLRRALDQAGFTSTKIQMADAPYLWMATARADNLKRSQAAWNATDFVAGHQYDYQEFLANPDMYDSTLKEMHDAAPDKPFLATEICLNDGKYQDNSYRLALQVGQLYQKDLTMLDSEMLLYCWLILDAEQPNFGVSRALLVPDRSRDNVPVASSFELRVLGAYSRHILKGMRRVESSSDTDLLTAAFTNGKQNTLVVLNRSTSRKTINVAWPGVHWTRVEHTSFYQENQEDPAAETTLVEPGEIVTLSDFAAVQ